MNIVTVKDLINELSKLQPDTPIMKCGYEGGLEPFDTIDLEIIVPDYWKGGSILGTFESIDESELEKYEGRGCFYGYVLSGRTH